MTLSISEANAVNTLLRFATGEKPHGEATTRETAIDAARVLLKGADKALMAGYKPDDATRLVGLIEMLRPGRIVTILGVDDWLVYGRDDEDHVWYTIVETLPAWLDMPHRGEAWPGTPEHAEDWRHMLAWVGEHAGDLDWYRDRGADRADSTTFQTYN